ncbi:MAG: NifU family protein [Myxococcota bacterium]|nr:NifU family protein [Myxococcota bacterium]
MGFLDKMRNSFSKEESPEVPQEKSRIYQVTFEDPGPHAVTCPIRFDQAVSPGGTSLFETPEEAAAWPAAQALLGIPGVHSIIGKGDVLVVARRESVNWTDILGAVEPALSEALGEVRASPPPVAAAVSPESSSAKTASPSDSAELRERVQAVIDRDINPAVADHGGVITLLDVQETRVFVHMGGGCQGCAMSTQTLKHGVESMLRAQVPEVTEILDTTDHASGANPYFQAE